MSVGLQIKHKCGNKDEAMLDVIFIHGITGGPENTWTNGDGVFWPCWLANDLPSVCIHTVGYPSSFFERPIKKEMNLHEQASNLAEHIVSCGLGKRALVFVCHSLGGLLAKETFRACCETQDEDWNALSENLKLIGFFATPHKGAPLAAVLKTLLPRASSAWINALSNETGYLMDLSNGYRDQAVKKGVSSLAFYEKHYTKGVALVVSPDAADPGVGTIRPQAVDADHIGICKLPSRDHTAYLSLRRHIGKVLEDIKRFNAVSVETHMRSESAKKLRQSGAELAEERVAEFLQKTVEDVGRLEETLIEFSKKRRVQDEVYTLSQRAVSELECLNIRSAKNSIELAAEAQLRGSLIDELSTYSNLKLMWGRAELLDGEIDTATETFLSIGAMLRPFSPLEAARYLRDAGRTCFNHGQSYGGAALSNSIRIYRRAIRYVPRRHYSYEWATIKNYLGESYRLMGRRNVESKYQHWLDEALREYRSSLKVLEVESDYYDTAMVRANIALTYGYKGRFEDQKVGIENLKRACREFEATLAELPSVENELLAAKVCHYLGNSYGEIGIRCSGAEKLEYLEKAIGRYEAALSNSEFIEMNERRANTLNNLANAIIQSCTEAPHNVASNRLQDAKKYCEDALRIRSKDRFPLEFAQSSTNLAHVYLLLSRVASEERFAYLRAAQQIREQAE